MDHILPPNDRAGEAGQGGTQRAPHQPRFPPAAPPTRKRAGAPGTSRLESVRVGFGAQQGRVGGDGVRGGGA